MNDLPHIQFADLKRPQCNVTAASRSIQHRDLTTTEKQCRKIRKSASKNLQWRELLLHGVPLTTPLAGTVTDLACIKTIEGIVYSCTSECLVENLAVALSVLTSSSAYALGRPWTTRPPISGHPSL